MKTRAVLVFIGLVGLGTLQIVADLMTWPRIKALAAGTQVSPAMKVFTAHEGYETHASRFALSWRDHDGAQYELNLDPEVYGNVKGPYNRRNVYGAALAYGPLLRNDPKLRPMQESVMHYAFCKPGQLRADLGIPIDATDLTARITPIRTPTRNDLELSWEIDCDE